MNTNKSQEKEKAYEIVVLDDLIGKAFKALDNEMEKNPKLGDLLKMIELRRKLLPNEEDQKQFWASLERIRQKNLADKETGTSEKLNARKKTTRRRKADNDA